MDAKQYVEIGTVEGHVANTLNKLPFASEVVGVFCTGKGLDGVTHFTVIALVPTQNDADTKGAA